MTLYKVSAVIAAAEPFCAHRKCATGQVAEQTP
jgi:hypothetical protein